MLCFLIDIIVNYSLSNYFIYLGKVVESENIFQSFFYFLIFMRGFLIIILKDYFFYLIYNVYQFFI